MLTCIGDETLLISNLFNYNFILNCKEVLIKDLNFVWTQISEKYVT